MEENRKPLVSYVCIFAAYFNNSYLLQFEYQQAQLEREIENLSWKVERSEATTVAVSLTLLYIVYLHHLLLVGFETTNEHD